MGNSPSTSRASSSSHAHSHSGHESQSPRSQSRRDAKLPIQGPNSRSTAAPPEPSQAQAQGSTTASASLPRSSLQSARLAASINSSAASAASASASSTPASSLQSTITPRAPIPIPSVSHDQQPPKLVDDVFTADQQRLLTDALDSAPSPQSMHSDNTTPLEAAALPSHNSMQDISFLTRPPRLPLPIEEEVHTPGSPIISATGDSTVPPVDDIDLDSKGLPRQASTLSTTTVDEDDAEELLVDKTRPTVPTRLEWLRGGEKVYVTGTIFQWNRKTRLHPVEGRPGVFAATIHILPGTHHIRFLVDGQMQTSPDLPTTVDFGNNLVNYIEVSADDVPSGSASQELSAANDVTKLVAPDSKSEEGGEGKRPPKERELPTLADFYGELPSYIADFDQDETSPLYQKALEVIDKLPGPPSLPGFLAKPILNVATQMKDDNSVLVMPSYTVLNHLNTASVKNDTLAVSATTRYQQKVGAVQGNCKYVTTIIYKPTKV